MSKSLLTLHDFSGDDLHAVFKRIKFLKNLIKSKQQADVLHNKVIGMFFEKPSTRTRAGFEAAAKRLGGDTIYLSPDETQMKRGEPLKDTARIFGSYLDAIVARVNNHETVKILSEYSGIPVINGLSDLSHPTQAICDLYTILEVKGSLEGLTLAYIGDGNNVCNSLILCCALAGVNMNIASPAGYRPDPGILNDSKEIAKKTGSRFNVVEAPEEAAKGADILYSDVWVSMGEEGKKEEKNKAFAKYQINQELVGMASKDVKVMHCLPAYRGLEITGDVLEGPQSIVWQQAENKMHSAAGILDYLLS